jgi:KUP system potassium uptake protein
MKQRAVSLDDFLVSLGELVDARSPGIAVFMAAGEGVPPAMRRVVSRFHALPQTVVLLSIVMETTPRVAPGSRMQSATKLDGGFHRVTLHYGFIEEADVHGDLVAVLPELGIVVPSSEIIYVIGRETFVATNRGLMGQTAETLFAFLSRNAKSATDYFQLPPDQVVEIGAFIDL